MKGRKISASSQQAWATISSTILKKRGWGEKEKEEGRETNKNNQSVVLMLTSLLGLWVPRIPHSYHSRNNRTLCTHKQGVFLGSSS